jgi:hypothetical protein
MEKKDFESKLGQKFTAKFDDGKTVELKLEAVDPLKKLEGFDKAREEPFSLIFSGSADMHLPDNTYVLSVEDTEEQAIFISAFKQEKDKIHYDSVFN